MGARGRPEAISALPGRLFAVCGPSGARAREAPPTRRTGRPSSRVPTCVDLSGVGRVPPQTDRATPMMWGPPAGMPVMTLPEIT